MGRAVSVTADTSTNPNTAATPADADPPTDSPATAVAKVSAYLQALEVEADAAQRIAEALDKRIDPDVADAAARTTAMLEAFDRWGDELASEIEVPEDADRVALVLALYGGRLLSDHPEGFDEPAALRDAVRSHLDAWEHGVLPAWPRQEMHRQPLGELPMVMRGEFWSGTYRWAMPASSTTPIETPKKAPEPSADAGEAKPT